MVDMKQITYQAKLALARKDFWEYCKLMASDFYKEDVGLSEEGVAYFLATSSKRTRNIK